MSNEALARNIEGIASEQDVARAWKKAVMMHRILQKVALRLEPGVVMGKGGGGGGSGWGSMADLVTSALDMKWLGLGDVNAGVEGGGGWD